MDSNGENIKQITNTQEIETYASWSPDNTKIICRKIISEDNWEIVVMNSDGSGIKNLTNNNMIDGWPVWSPDGKRIAYTSFVGDRSRIFVMDADGDNKKQISDEVPTDDRQPWWHPEDSTIVFSRYTWFSDPIWYETADIYIVKTED
jgi:TolB protein